MEGALGIVRHDSPPTPQPGQGLVLAMPPPSPLDIHPVRMNPSLLSGQALVAASFCRAHSGPRQPESQAT